MGNSKKQNYRSFQTIKGGHFMQLYDDMMESAAWSQLTANDIVLYISMLRKLRVKYTHGMLDKTNEDNISMPKQEYLKLMHQVTFFKSIDHLIDLGFIKVIEDRYSIRQCTIYGFNDMWKKYGTPSFCIKDEWKRVKNRMY